MTLSLEYGLTSSSFLQIFTLETPFSGLRDGDVVLRVAQKKERPPKLPDYVGRLGLSDRLWRLIEICWDHYPQRRPNMDAVVQKLASETSICNDYHNPPTGLDLQKVDVFYVPDSTVILPPIDSVRTPRTLRSRGSSTTLTRVSGSCSGSPWWNGSEL